MSGWPAYLLCITSSRPGYSPACIYNVTTCRVSSCLISHTYPEYAAKSTTTRAKPMSSGPNIKTYGNEQPSSHWGLLGPICDVFPRTHCFLAGTATGHISSCIRPLRGSMTYDYVCTACGHSWECEQRITEAPVRVCPHCRKPGAKRQISGGSGFILKGGGWYSDLYSSPREQTASSGDSKSDIKPESKSNAKSDSKPASSADSPTATGAGGAPAAAASAAANPPT
jgi:putative FmdB family regulatory protein